MASLSREEFDAVFDAMVDLSDDEFSSMVTLCINARQSLGGNLSIVAVVLLNTLAVAAIDNQNPKLAKLSFKDTANILIDTFFDGVKEEISHPAVMEKAKRLVSLREGGKYEQ